MEQAFASLEEEQRLLLTLRDLENMSYEEIRQVSGLPIGTVKSKLHRARMALHERFVALQAGPK
jgi:RNA polymerase sigma-70 factor (ECF subfamily)